MSGLQEDLDIIKSLIAISRGGLLMSKVATQYRDMTESSLSFTKYGFNSLKAMLESSSNICLVQTSEGIKCQVQDAKLSHVTSLVNRTQVPRKRSDRTKQRYKSRPSFNTSRSFSSQSQRRNSFQSSSSSSPLRFQPRQPFQPSNKSQPQKVSSYNTSPSARRPDPIRIAASAMGNPGRNSQTNYRSTQEGSNRPHHSGSTARTATVSQREQSDFAKRCFGDTEKSVVRSDVSNPCRNGQSNNCSIEKEIRTQHSHSSSHTRNQQSDPVKFYVRDTVRNDVPSSLLVRKESTTKNCVKTDSGSDWSADSVVDGGKLKISSSGSGWSSDSSSAKSKQVSQSNSRQVNIRSVVVKGSSCPPKVSSLRVTVPNDNINRHVPVSSDSDWSTDSEEVPSPKSRNTCAGHSRTSQPVQNGTVSSTSYTFTNQESSPPLMVGGIGRGRHRSSQVMKPGMTSVQGPSTREVTQTTSRNGLSSLVVTVPNQIGSRPASQRPPKMYTCAEPSYEDYQFIGDFLLLRVAEVSLNTTVSKRGPISYCGMCRSDLTISECERDIKKFGVEGKLVIMLGMTDIVQGVGIQEMKKRMASLLAKLKYLHVILLTLPVLPYFIRKENERKLAVLQEFNNWLLQLPYCVIDTDCHLYTDPPFFFMRVPQSKVDTFSEGGSWIVMDLIISTINEGF